MNINAIFVGKPRWVEYNGREIQTSIFKTPISGAINVSKLNIEGDEQSDLNVHGGVNKAVYAYPSEHYNFWQEQYPTLTFEPGVFGENLSLTGLDESVCVGNQYKIGSVILEVTTPRLPCFKLGLKMGDSKFIKIFLAAEKSGWYFKVIKEGKIRVGNNILKLKEDGYNLTIKELVQLYTTRKKDKILLEKAINSPTLQKSWVTHFKEQFNKL